MWEEGSRVFQLLSLREEETHLLGLRVGKDWGLLNPD